MPKWLICLWLSAAAFMATAQEAKLELVPQQGHTHYILETRCSPDGRTILSSSYDGTIKVWDTQSGTLMQTTRLEDIANRLEFSADGKRFYEAGNSGYLTCFDTATLKALYRRKLASASAARLSVNHQDGLVALGCVSGQAVVARSSDGILVRELGGRDMAIDSIAFCGHQLLAVGAADGVITLWNWATGAKVREWTVAPHPIAMLFSAESELLFLATGDNKVHAFSLDGVEHYMMDCEGDLPIDFVISSDGRLLVSTVRGFVRVFERSTGKKLSAFPVSLAGNMRTIAMVNSSTVVVGANDGMSTVDLKTERIIHTYMGSATGLFRAYLTPDRSQVWVCLEGGNTLVFSRDSSRPQVIERPFGENTMAPDGQRFLIAGSEGWDVYNTKTLSIEATLAGKQTGINAFSFSPDGTRFASRSAEGVTIWSFPEGRTVSRLSPVSQSGSFCFLDRTHFAMAAGQVVEIWDTVLRAKVHTLRLPHDCYSLAIAPQQTLLVGSFMQGTISRVRIADGRSIARLPGGHGPCFGIFANPNRTQFWAAYRDGTAVQWDLQSNRVSREFRAHDSIAGPMSFSADGELILTSAIGDSSARIWSTIDLTEQARIMAFQDGSWGVFDPQFRFDTDNEYAHDNLIWVWRDNRTQESFRLPQFASSFYTHRLLQLILQGEQPPAVPHITRQTLPPVASQVSSAGDRISFDLSGTTAKTVVNVIARGQTILTTRGSEGRNEVRLPLNARLQPEDIAISVSNGTVSRSVPSTATPGGEAEPQGRRYVAVVAGVSEYADASMNLKFPKEDAVAIAKAIADLAQGMGRIPEIFVLCSGVNPSELPAGAQLMPPTRENFDKVFQTIAASEPFRSGDVFCLFLAGHGLTFTRDGGDDERYAFLTSGAEVRTAAPTVQQLERWITSDDLQRWLVPMVNAQKFLVVDTCAAGSLGTEIAMHQQARELGNLLDATLLMACSPNRASYEMEAVKHGLLTYSVLLSLKIGHLAADLSADSVMVALLNDRARTLVSCLTRSLLKVDQSPEARYGPRGNFLLGTMTAPSREVISLQLLLPLVQEVALEDVDLERKINDALRRELHSSNPCFFAVPRGTPNSARLRLEERDGKFELTVVWPDSKVEVTIPLTMSTVDTILEAVRKCARDRTPKESVPSRQSREGS